MAGTIVCSKRKNAVQNMGEIEPPLPYTEAYIGERGMVGWKRSTLSKSTLHRKIEIERLRYPLYSREVYKSIP